MTLESSPWEGLIAHAHISLAKTSHVARLSSAEEEMTMAPREGYQTLVSSALSTGPPGWPARCCAPKHSRIACTVSFLPFITLAINIRALSV